MKILAIITIVLVTIMGDAIDRGNGPSPNNLDPDLVHTMRYGYRVQCTTYQPN